LKTTLVTAIRHRHPKSLADWPHFSLFTCAAEIGTYLRYCRSLDFFQTPDYNYLRQLFWDVFNREQFEDDGVYDWTKVPSDSRKSDAPSTSGAGKPDGAAARTSPAVASPKSPGVSTPITQPADTDGGEACCGCFGGGKKSKKKGKK
jgi:hypothetical protein